MSLTTDKVRPSPKPSVWRIGSLTMAGVTMGVCLLAFCTGVLAIGKFSMNLGIEALRTLAFVVLVFGSQATIYAIRERRHLWGTRPSLWLVVSSVADILIASTLAVGGIAMTSLPPTVVAGTLAAAAAFAFVLDLVKVPVFARLGIAERPHDRSLTDATGDVPKTEKIPSTEPGPAQPKASDAKPGAKADPQPEAKAAPAPDAKAEPKPDVTAEPKSDATTEPKPDAKAEPKPDAKAVAAPDAKVEPKPDVAAEPKPDAPTEPKPDAKTEPKPDAKAEPKPESRVQTQQDATPQLVKRVHELYEQLGREDVRAVEEWEKASREKRKDDA
jgi:hypothetical protein